MLPAPIALAEVLESTEAVVAATTALLLAFGTLFVTLYRGGKWAKAQIEQLQLQSGQTLHEVRNDHADNLRDDMDNKFNSVHVKLDQLGESINELQRSDTRQWQRTADLGSRDEKLADRLTALEQQQREQQENTAHSQ